MPEFGIAKLVLKNVFGGLERLLVQSWRFKVQCLKLLKDLKPLKSSIGFGNTNFGLFRSISTGNRTVLNNLPDRTLSLFNKKGY